MGSFRFVLVLATCWFLQTTRGDDSCNNLRVVGGHKVTIRDVPFIAGLVQNDDVVCVGTIIHESFILTAASCSSDEDETEKVLVGTSRLNKGGKHYDVEEEICHSDFDSTTMENDICLLKLKSKIKFNRRVAKVRLPNANLYIEDGTMLNVTGWGSIDTAETKYPTQLHQTTVPKISNKCCSEEYDDITDAMICAGSQGHDACKGDAGAPLTVNNLLVGVFSTGDAEGCGSSSGIYTKVSEYLNWIDEKISEHA